MSAGRQARAAGRLLTIGLAALLALAPAGCGKRGPLEAPAGQEDTSKRVYPAQ